MIQVRKFLSNVAAAVGRAWARLRTEEPARLAERVRLLLVAAVTLGWITVDEAWINSVVSAVAVVGSLLLTRQVRASVAPVSKLDE